MAGPEHQERASEAEIEPEAIRSALAHIQAAAAFVASRQLSAFLAYVVDKTLAGEGNRIKAYSIATEALGRPETFDPASDPIVRVEAGRLRKALDAYYQAEGAEAAVRIALPRGSYVPRFERVEFAETEEACDPDAPDAEPSGGFPAAPASGDRPGSARARLWLGAALFVLAMLPALSLLGVRHISDPSEARASVTAAGLQARPPALPSVKPPALPSVKPLAPRIFVAPFTVSDETAVGIDGSQFAVMLGTAIGRFDEVTVLTRMDGDADYLVSGRLSAGPAGITASTLLTDRASGHVIWSAQSTLPRNPIRPLATLIQLKGGIATALAQPYGVVLADRLSRSHQHDDGFACLIRAFDYWHSFDPSRRGPIQDCLEEMARRFPDYPLSYAQLAFLHLSEGEIAADPGLQRAALDRAVEASTRAVQLAPTSARAMQALQFTYYASGEMERAIEAGSRAMRLNQLDTDIRASQGQMMIVAGRHQLGRQLIEDAAASNTAHPSWYDLYLALAAFQSGNREKLRTLMGRVDLPDHPLAAVLEIIAAPDEAASRKALADMRTRFPALAADTATVLNRILPNPALVEKLAAAVRQRDPQS